MNLIILGPQGSGKGTQAKMLADKFGLEHVEMGKLLRDIAKQDNPLGKQIHERINIQGKLVDDEIIRKVVKAKLDTLPKEKGIIFDGVPRNMKQAQAFDAEIKAQGRNIDAVLDINLPEKDSIERISKRRVCLENEHVLIFGKDVFREEYKCPICGSKIEQRIDDTPDRIKTRLGIYFNDTKPIVDHYRRKGILIEIDGRPSIGEVSRMILSEIEKIAG